ncbi:MAG: malto-oligosyltrehalose trehalohydrolase [Verrucomicrobiota bacterium]|nr:malto-oligosyltrehalose trehalohydrolase [Verrucomicrobiota bacterium]
MEDKRRYPIGAELVAPDRTHFRVWAPQAKILEVALADGVVHPLTAERDGYFAGAAPCSAGAHYKFRIDGEDAYPDPASRYQPDGPHGVSCVVDPFAFRWTDDDWRGLSLAGQIIYEFHVGTFTPAGTWRAAIDKLPALREMGITLLEMMPIADFPGRFGWGYDGVNMFAPCRLYGAPDDLRAFVDAAHGHGLGVILDVVYNHFGPDGNYLGNFSAHYLHRTRKNDWGDLINFDGPNCEQVREFFFTNARYWIEEFHFDGFRFDATQGIFDSSGDYVVGAIGRIARAAAGQRQIVLVAENEPQETRLVRRREVGGDELDGLWNDDWHHSAMVALTGRNEAYYGDYHGAPQEFVSAAKYGYLFQGQPYFWQTQGRGEPTHGTAPEAFISFIENHDQVSNSPFGERVRLLTSPGRYRAMTALLLLGPWTPMLFQGQEFGASTPFTYFSEPGDEKLRAAVRKGRFEFLAQFPSAANAETQARLPDPGALDTFERSKLRWEERMTDSVLYLLHRDLIQLRRHDKRFREHGRVDGAVLNDNAFLLRYFSERPEDERLVLVNFGKRFPLQPAPEPLLAPPFNFEWESFWTSESVKYGGFGPTEVVDRMQWILLAESAVALRPVSSPRSLRISSRG